MNKLAYFIITLFFLTMLPISAEDENRGCKWETVEETEQFIREQCVGDGQLQVRMKSKPVPGVTVIEAPNTKKSCLLYTSPSPRDRQKSRMPSSA